MKFSSFCIFHRSKIKRIFTLLVSSRRLVQNDPKLKSPLILLGTFFFIRSKLFFYFLIGIQPAPEPFNKFIRIRCIKF